MAGEWLKFEKATPDKPEVFAIATVLGIDPDAVVGKLLRVWSWFDTHTESGNAKSVTHAFLDRIAGLSGFAVAMQNVNWLLLSDDGVSLPAFDKHTGQTAKGRAETARRVSQHRAGTKEKRSAIPRPLRADIAARDGSACVYCSRKEGQYMPPELVTAGILTLDHVIPLSRGGAETDRNLVCACLGCNMFKSNRTPDECGLRWPIDESGRRYGESVTAALPREEKRREEKAKAPVVPKGDSEAAVLSAYHSALPKCQEINVLNPKRKRRIADAVKLARQVCAGQGWAYVPADFWAAYFAECAADPWLRGDRPNPNNPRWVQNLDVLLAEDRFAEIMDKAIAAMRRQA